MPFFKSNKDASDGTLARLDFWIWTLVYAGLGTVVLGLFVSRQPDGDGTGWMIGGGIVAAIGAVLWLVRARLTSR